MIEYDIQPWEETKDISPKKNGKKTPIWAKALIKDVAELKKQTLTNCNKLDKFGVQINKMSKELPIIRVKIDTLCRTGNVTETHLNRIEREVIKIKKKL